MKWSIKIVRLLGIDVYLHITFLLLLGFIGLVNWLPERNAAAAVDGLLFFTLLFGCVLLHEYGHALMARRYGINTRDITLLPIGGVARLERMPEKPLQELWVALAGPAVNVVIAAGLAAWLVFTGAWQPISTLSLQAGGLVERLLAVNVFLVLFNLLPAFPMDGGRVLRAVLALRMEYSRATRIAATVGQGMALIFGFLGLFGNPMLLLIALFVWMGATQEAAAAEMKSSFGGVPVREAMLTDFRTLSSEATLADAIEYLLAGHQQEFPVVERGRVIGMLYRQDLFRALREKDQEYPVTAVMKRDFPTVEEYELLDTAFARAQADHSLTLTVVRDGMLVGLLTAENVMELAIIRSAVASRTGASGPAVKLRSIPPVMYRKPITNY